MESEIFQWNDNVLVESGRIRWNQVESDEHETITQLHSIRRHRTPTSTTTHNPTKKHTRQPEARHSHYRRFYAYRGIVFTERRCKQTKPREISPVIACDAGFTGLMPLRGGVHIKITGIKNTSAPDAARLAARKRQCRNDFLCVFLFPGCG